MCKFVNANPVVMKKEEYVSDFEQLYVAYFSKMKRFAKEFVLSEEDAENIVHDVFLDVWEKRDVLSYHVNLPALLFTSIKNKCIDYLRRKIVEREAGDTIKEEHRLNMQIKFDSLEAFDQHLFNEKDIETILMKAIDSLPDKCRTIFIMSKLEGKKQKEVAAELNITVNTVETQMGIAYKKLRTELKDYLPLLLFLICL